MYELFVDIIASIVTCHGMHASEKAVAELPMREMMYPISIKLQVYAMRGVCRGVRVTLSRVMCASGLHESGSCGMF